MPNSQIDPRVPSPRHFLLRRRKIFVPAAVAGAVTLALAGAYIGTCNQAMAMLPAQTTEFAGPPSFAEIAQRVTPAVVNVTEKGSAAEKAGIRPGSLLTMVGTQEVNSPDEAVSRVRKTISDGDHAVLLRVEQDGRARFLAVRPAA